jgi:hypothetical protein
MQIPKDAVSGELVLKNPANGSVITVDGLHR